MKKFFLLGTILSLVGALTWGSTNRQLEATSIRVGPSGGTLTLPNTTDTVTVTADTNSLVKLDGSRVFSGNQSLGSHKLTNVTDPTSAQDAATKNYVDSVTNGLTWKQAVKYASTAALAAGSYSNGALGVGATFTETGNGALSIDSTTPSVSDRILIKDQASGLQNGIYSVTTVGSAGTQFVLTRVTDYDQAAEISQGDTVYVSSGSTLGNTAWSQTAAGPFVVGTTALSFTQVSGPGAIVAGTGITISGSTVSLTTPVSLANGGTNATSKGAAFDSLSPFTTLGDLLYGGTAGTGTRLAGNTSATRKYLGQTGTGTVSAAPTLTQPDFSELLGTATDGQLATSYIKADGSRTLSANWDAGAHTITASVFSGALSGNATSATTATTATSATSATTATTATTATNSTNAATTATNSTNASFFPTFVASSSSGNQGIDTATGLTFNPSTNTLTTTTFSGALTGSASNNLSATANNHGVLISGSGNTATVIAPDASTSKVLVSGGASADPGWSLLTNSNLSGTAAITNANLATMATHTYKGNKTAGSATPTDLTQTELTAELNSFVGDSGSGGTKGLVPAPASGDGAAGKVLKADGTWATVSGTGDFSSNTSSSVDSEIVLFSGTAGKTGKRATGTGAVSVTSGVYAAGTLSVGNGGTGLTAPTAHNMLIGNGSSAITSLAPSTSGKFAVSDGTDWTARTLSTSDFIAPTGTRLTSTGTQTGWLFTISTSSTMAAGDTYTNNSNTYTALAALSAQSGDVLFMSGTGATSGTTLTRATGSGTSSITFSSKVALATYITPTSPRTPLALEVTLVGGGGGGGGSGTASQGTGSDGTSSYFGANTLKASNGSGAAIGNVGAGGACTISQGTAFIFHVGGAGSGGSENVTVNASTLAGGVGGSNCMGGAGAGGVGGSAGGNAQANTGGGGGGGGCGVNATAFSAGGGGAGCCIQGVIFTSPAATYPYIIGTGGTHGSAGTNGQIGGDAAAGELIVKEIYQ